MRLQGVARHNGSHHHPSLPRNRGSEKAKASRGIVGEPGVRVAVAVTMRASVRALEAAEIRVNPHYAETPVPVRLALYEISRQA